MIHVVEVNEDETRTQLVDHIHLCSSVCQADWLLDHEYESDRGAGIQGNVSYGAWPGGCETDYDEFCASCGDFLWEGTETDREREDLT